MLAYIFGNSFSCLLFGAVSEDLSALPYADLFIIYILTKFVTHLSVLTG